MIEPLADRDTAPRERTMLAWNRVSLAIAGNGALLIHTGLSDRQHLLTAAGCSVAAIGALLWLVSSTVAHSSPAGASRWIMSHPSVLPLLAAIVLAISMIDLIGVAVQ